VTFHATWDYRSDDERIALMDKMAAAGIEWVRIDFCWCQFELRGRGVINEPYVALVDRIVDAARARHLKVLGILWGTPPWANGGGNLNVPPSIPDDYGSAAEWVAAHFRGRVAAWEVWNEPNLNVFWTGDVKTYVDVLRAAYPRLKAGDPKARVVFGGLSYNDERWLARAYGAGARGYFDVMATHPYQGRGDAPPEAADDGKRWWLTHLPAVRKTMVAHGDGQKPIWLTEFGWSSFDHNAVQSFGRRGVSEQVQADYLLRTIKLVRSRYPYVTNVFWYNERNTVAGNPWEDNLGLLNRDLSEKPVYRALRTFLLQARRGHR
jgi:aryl-phospho-beta-D-glucosidase BglC (GH1 family)